MIVETGPASSVAHLLSGLEELNVKLEDVAYVAVSHVHLDHGGGAGVLLKSLPNAKVIVHPKGAAHLVNPEKLWLQSREVLGDVAEIYGAPEPVPKNRIIAATDGMTFDAGSCGKLKVVETLGHASHHLSFYSSLHKGIFPGDAAGIYLRRYDVVVPTTPPPFRLDSSLASLEKLESLNPEVLYYSHFGKASEAAKHLRGYAKQIRMWAEIAGEGIRNKQSVDAIKERILAEDEAMRKIASFLAANPILMRTAVENSVQGFVEFAKKFLL